MLFGVMQGHEEGDLCSCGHTAINHSPCCGACMICGTRICDEFSYLNLLQKEIEISHQRFEVERQVMRQKRKIAEILA